MRFSSKDWDRISSGWSAWWHHEIDRPMVVVDSLKWQGMWFVKHHEGWDTDKNIYPIDPILDYYQRLIEEQIYYGDSWPHWWPNFGPGVMAGFVGAGVENHENTIWFDPSCSMDFEEIVLSYYQGNFWWNWVRELTRAAVDRWGSQVTVAHTVLGGNKLCQIYTSPAGALDVFRELGGKGFAFWITDPYPQEELEAFFDTLETLL